MEPGTYCQYSIIRFLPDATIGEQVNIGVIAFDSTTVRVRIISNWDRANAFNGKPDIDRAVREACESLSQMTTGQEVLDAAAKWGQCVQLSTPAGSLRSVDEAMAFLMPRFCHETGILP